MRIIVLMLMVGAFTPAVSVVVNQRVVWICGGMGAYVAGMMTALPGNYPRIKPALP